MSRSPTVGRYLCQRLEQAGLGHVFGIPGDYVLGFYEELSASELSVVGTCAEIGAGYAADAYARVNGLGCLCVTYCVGGLNALNAVAGAYAEKSPLVVISGAPGLDERRRSPLLHHQVRDFRTQLQIFEKVTVAAECIEAPEEAPDQIERAFEACFRYKRPIYLELPRDVVAEPCGRPRGRGDRRGERSDPHALAEAVAETCDRLRRAKRPVILAGVEVHRFNLQSQLRALVEESGFPVAATLLGKSVISERHPQYLGVYEGAMGRSGVRQAVEKADCLLILGAFMTDINLGVWTARIDETRTVNATSERITVSHHHYEGVTLRDFLSKLRGADYGRKRRVTGTEAEEPAVLQPRRNKPITVRRFFRRLNEFLGDDNIVIADIGDSLFGAVDLTIHKRTEFLSPAYYTSMGFAVPAALGAQMNKPSLRPIVLVGDGAFQMTGQELSSIVRQGLNPMVFVLNNKGYTTERFIHEGAYNDINDWAYHLMPTVIRDGWGCEARTEDELEHALERAAETRTCFAIVNVHLDRMDRSDALARLGKRLGDGG